MKNKKEGKRKILDSYRGKLVLTIASLAVFLVLAVSFISFQLANGDKYLIGSQTDFDFPSYDELFAEEGYDLPFFRIITVIDDRTGESHKALSYIRYLYERSTMRKLGILVAEISNDAIFDGIGYIS